MEQRRSPRVGDVPTVFHGTGLNDAQHMARPPGQIDVTQGGGEFGRGFYTQYASWGARAWAIRVAPRLNGAPCVLRLDIDSAAYGGFGLYAPGCELRACFNRHAPAKQSRGYIRRWDLRRDRRADHGEYGPHAAEIRVRKRASAAERKLHCSDGDPMTPIQHQVHFLTLAAVNTTRGWLAPLELSEGCQQQGTHVVPVHSGSSLFPRYRVEFARCMAGGGQTSDWSEMDLQQSGFLKLLIDSWSLRFSLRKQNGQPVLFDYVGILRHPDFRYRLAEIVPENEQDLEDLYAQRGIVIVGCDPVTEYGGVNALNLPRHSHRT